MNNIKLRDKELKELLELKNKLKVSTMSGKIRAYTPILIVKSNPENYVKEESGKKPNTLRKLPFGDGRDDILAEMVKTKYYGVIQVEKTNSHDFFIKPITDITLWDGYAIISWRN